jgi:hypothetical protein
LSANPHLRAESKKILNSDEQTGMAKVCGGARAVDNFAGEL